MCLRKYRNTRKIRLSKNFWTKSYGSFEFREPRIKELKAQIKPNFTSRAFSPLRGSSTLGETAGGFTSRSGPLNQDAADLLENYNGEDDKKCFAMTALLYSVLTSLSSLEVSWEEDRLAGRKIQ